MAIQTGFARITDDLTIRYQSTGSGDLTVLLVPGWTMTSDVFERQLAHFEDATHARLVAIDPRSQGLSTHTSEGNYYEQHGRDLHAFIETLELKHVVLGGWSNGGFDILAYVNQFGSARLKGLIMLDAAPAGIGSETDWVWFTPDDANGFRRFVTMGVLTGRQKFNMEFAQWMAEAPTPDYLSWIERITSQTGDGTAALLNESSAYQNYADDLKALEGKIPLLYFVREDWRSVVSAWARLHTPSATVAAVGKHIAFWERADEFNAAVDRFLAPIMR